ncbi:MAG: aminotransferase class IV [Nitriliruptoraceae bacterium]
MDTSSSSPSPAAAEAAAEPPAAGDGPVALAWADGRVLPATEATVPLADDGFLRGDAVFEAMLVRSGRTHALELHLERMHRSAAALELPLDERTLRHVIADLLASWGPHDGAVRVITTRGGVIRGLIGPAVWPSTIALGIVHAPWRSAISGVKTLSYAANQWAVRQARAVGADDALIVDGDIVHELPTGSLVLVHDGICSTPDPDQLPILASVSVAVLQQLVEVTPTTPGLEQLLAADELMVLSATRPCLPVHALHLPDGQRLELPAPGPVTTQLQAQLQEHIASTLDPSTGA